ncbi:mycothiol transferase [Streptomyces lydicus]|uniref:mycothiol transferase n=1 Tax=Streptomyces lydicus TaxID=47763 RepID=UPI0028707855|nr:DinB family protein [Streptomyces lydicus]
MTASTDLLVDAFGRIREAVEEAVDGLDPDEIASRPAEETNSVGWLVWHLTRIQDDHVAGVAGTEQVWTADGWYERFGLPFAADDTGYGHSPEEVAAVRELSAELLTDYHEAVHDATVQYLAGVEDKDYKRVVDRAWSPPVTLGVRLVSVISDGLQHVGQAAYVRGLLGR